MKTLRLILLAIATISVCIYSDAQTLKSYPTDTIDNQIFYRYTPEKSIGLYRISKIFGVSQDDIIRYNPQLKDRGPQLGEVLLIPSGKLETLPQKADTTVMTIAEKPLTSFTPIVQIHDTLQPDTAIQPMDTAAMQIIPADIQADTIITDTTALDTNAIRIAIVLPLNADAAERDAGDDRFLDFYLGSLIAVKQAADAGLAVEIHTYDVSRNDRELGEVINDPFFTQAHAVIGPAYSGQVGTVINALPADSVWMLVPFTSNVPGIEQNSRLLQFNPTAQMEAEEMASYIANRENEINVITVEAKEADIPYSIRLLREQLASRQVSLSSVTLRQILSDSLSHVLRDSAENILLLNTERYSNLQVLMPYLTRANQTHLLTLVSQYSWQKENIPLGRIYPSVFSQQSVNETDSTAYAEEWQKYFPFSPSSGLPRYDLLGYDLTRHLLWLLVQSRDMADPDYMHYLVTRQYNGLQSVILYRRNKEEGGYINAGIQIIAQ